MKINRERILALIAVLIVVVGLKDVVIGFVSPTRGIEVRPYSPPTGGTPILRRRYRTFTEETDPGRNPFSFSEGWERLDSIPLEPPPLPLPPRPVPFLSHGPSPVTARLLFEAPPEEVTKEVKK